MNEVEDRLRTHIPLQIAKMWNERKKAAVKEMKDKDPEGYKLFFSSKNVKLAKDKYLKDILRGTIQTLTEVFPVFLVTPQVATQIIEGEGKEFDLFSVNILSIVKNNQIKLFAFAFDDLSRNLRRNQKNGKHFRERLNRPPQYVFQIFIFRQFDVFGTEKQFVTFGVFVLHFLDG